MFDAEYVPPKVWKWEPGNGGAFASINRPTAGAQREVELPRGEHKLQLHSLATPNGQKVTIMLEELLAAGHDAEYDAYLINIGKGDQFGSGFVEINPNSKIPAMIDYGPAKPIRLFESGSILVYLADKFDAFLSKDVAQRAETMNWLFWQMGSAPFLGGGFGHFFAYAPTKIQYAIDRYAMEAKRQLDVLDRQLGNHEYVSGSEYTVADMAIWPWYGGLVLGRAYNAAEFLDVESYKNVVRWAKQLDAREAVKRGRIILAGQGPEDEIVTERHSAADVDKVMEVRRERGTI
ncbi:glutathione-dependent disulfide-bond oxidoreductase [Devosia rhizoryzae]|uniref:Glutathione-dependent disulfide-bond oxidoreductase n=1 Tax=Devosia rhizoryzae TaxID=2774137 RepID=A0ABX7CDC6_9HYPH|nr:glutathione-dependent disulfide-bond oxidoreductase [Devosia rhizoryzae]QQR39956.1 glutathione-dependent disulfide-bond oxidoreductase [Devosia rhizoryzae]